MSLDVRTRNRSDIRALELDELDEHDELEDDAAAPRPLHAAEPWLCFLMSISMMVPNGSNALRSSATRAGGMAGGPRKLRPISAGVINSSMISRWSSFLARSATIGWPPMSLPSASASGEVTSS